MAFDTLTGSDIDESALAQVPGAAVADNASALGGIGPFGYLRRDVSPFTALAPAGDWEAIPETTPPGYFVDPAGFVHLHGALRRATGSSTLALTLPAAITPAGAKRLPVYAESAGGGGIEPAGVTIEPAGVTIAPSGELAVNASDAAAEGLISLEGITFRPGD
ncbi:MAG: hypothetical protein ACR2GL_04350 [Thermoleophilaceae bacterium]